jgi:hypothetical protein
VTRLQHPETSLESHARWLIESAKIRHAKETFIFIFGQAPGNKQGLPSHCPSISALQIGLPCVLRRSTQDSRNGATSSTPLLVLGLFTCVRDRGSQHQEFARVTLVLRCSSKDRSFFPEHRIARQVGSFKSTGARIAMPRPSIQRTLIERTNAESTKVTRFEICRVETALIVEVSANATLPDTCSLKMMAILRR